MATVPYGALDAVLLDLGNTLVGMDADLVCTLLAAEGHAHAPAAFRRAEAAARPVLSAWIAGGDGREPLLPIYAREILVRLGIDLGDHPALVARLVERLRAVPTEILWSSTLPGVPEALAALRRAGLALVVVSNSDGSAERGLERLGLRAFVDAVVDSAAFGCEKPHPRIFAHAITLVGASPERVAHVGDLYAVDVVGARAAGAHAVLLDPFGDWDGVDCEVAADLAELARRIVAARGTRP